MGRNVLTQKGWRIAGGVCIGCAAFMAWWGVHWEPLRSSVLVFAGYWLVFLCLLIVALICAMVDMRYIRLQYALGKRKAFEDTLGDEKFRKALLEAEGQIAREREE